MGTALIFATLLVSTFGFPKLSEPEECSVCQEAVQKLMDLADSNIAVQEYVLTHVVCLQFPSQMQCISGVMQRWSKIFKIIYNSEETIPIICKYVNPGCRHQKENFIFFE